MSSWLRERSCEIRYRELVKKYSLTNFPSTYNALKSAFSPYPIPLEPDAFFGMLYSVFTNGLSERVNSVRSLLDLEKDKTYSIMIKEKKADIEKFHKNATGAILELRYAFDESRLNTRLEPLASALNKGTNHLRDLIPAYNNIMKSIMEQFPDAYKGRHTGFQH